MFRRLILILSCMFFFAIPASAQDTGWQINDFHADITINPDTTVQIKETILVDFNDLYKHGIYRTIPVKYKDKYNNNLNIRFKLLNTSHQYQLKNEGNNINLRLGDPDTTVSGQQLYTLSYQVEQVITQPQNQAEFYWNLTGDQWPVPILNASAIVTGPENSLLDTVCFSGIYGSTETDCTKTSTGTIAQFSAQNLYPGENLTLAVKINNGSLNFPSWQKHLQYFLTDNWLYFLPLITLIFLFYRYFTHSRDQIGTPALIYGPPDKILPAEAGAIIDETVHDSDLTATIIDLARRGFFTIKEIKNDFELTLNHQAETGLKKFETEILDLLFGTSRKSATKLKHPPQNAYQHLDKTKQALYDQLTQEKYFRTNPSSVRAAYLIIGLVTAGLGFIFGIPLVLTGTIIAAFAKAMPSRPAEGKEAFRQITGLKEWVRLGAWREQIHEKHNFLEEVLPFAIAFGLTQKFLKAFKAADIQNLSWYQSTSGQFHLASFNRNFNSGVASTRPKTSGSSFASGGSGFSGGSSGGGGGGGGGGSW